LNVSLIFGAELAEGVAGTMSLSSKADTGGLVARGDGTAAGKPKEFCGPLLNPKLGKFGVAGVGGFGIEDEGVAGVGPLLNSAHRGHFRLVSVKARINKRWK
jgi:hypothetical protein